MKNERAGGSNTSSDASDSGQDEVDAGQRGGRVEPRAFGDAERLELSADALEDLQDRGLPRLA